MTNLNVLCRNVKATCTNSVFLDTSATIRTMADDPSSLPKKLVPDCGTRNFARMSCVPVPEKSGNRNLDQIGSCTSNLEAHDSSAPLLFVAFYIVYVVYHLSDIICHL